VQREKAQAAAAQIGQFVADVQSQIGWTRDVRWFALPLDQRRFDYVRLLRQVPAITTLTQLDAEGKEMLKVDRLTMDKVDSGVDYSKDPRFIEAMAHETYSGPVYYRKQTEPYMSLAFLTFGSKRGVTLADVNLARMWDIIRKISVGDSGYAYVVDGKGRMIAGRDLKFVLTQPDLSALPQVAAVLTARPGTDPGEGGTFDTSPKGASVLSASAAVPALGWHVFVELPTAEAYAPLWAALIRSACLLGLGIMAALLASLVATRRATPARPAAA
jgi:hypothetical protein